MCVLDGKQFCSLEEGGRQHCDEEVETCVMAFNQQVCLASIPWRSLRQGPVLTPGVFCMMVPGCMAVAHGRPGTGGAGCSQVVTVRQ